jgi:hypothetical protein
MEGYWDKLMSKLMGTTNDEHRYRIKKVLNLHQRMLTLLVSVIGIQANAQDSYGIKGTVADTSGIRVLT